MCIYCRAALLNRDTCELAKLSHHTGACGALPLPETVTRDTVEMWSATGTAGTIADAAEETGVRDMRLARDAESDGATRAPTTRDSASAGGAARDDARDTEDAAAGWSAAMPKQLDAVSMVSCMAESSLCKSPRASDIF